MRYSNYIYYIIGRCIKGIVKIKWDLKLLKGAALLILGDLVCNITVVMPIE